MANNTGVRIKPAEPPYDREVASIFKLLTPQGMEPLKLFRTVAHNKPVLKNFLANGKLVYTESSLDKLDRELGYICYQKGLRAYSYLCFYLYSLMSLLVLGHYRYGSIGELSFKINLLIFVEAFAAFLLIFYTSWLQLHAKR